MKKRRKIIIIGGILVLSVFIVYLINFPKITGNVIRDYEEINITYDNFEEVLSKNEIVEDLPEKTKILLGEYGRDSSKEYLIERGKVTEVEEKPEVDFEVYLDSKYLDELTNNNYCSVLRKIIKNNDFKYKLNQSRLKLFWKYKRMIKYGNCFGIM